MNEGNFENIIRYIDSVAQILRLSTGTDPDSIQKRKLLKDKLVELYKVVFSSNANFINGDLRKSVIATLTKLLEKSDEIIGEAISNTVEILGLTFNEKDENNIHTTVEEQALPEEIGKQAILMISNIIEQMDLIRKIKLKK